MPIAQNSLDSDCPKLPRFRLQIPIAQKCPYSDCLNSYGVELLRFRLPRFWIAPIPIGPNCPNSNFPKSNCPDTDFPWIWLPKIALISIVPLPLLRIILIPTSDCTELPRFPSPLIPMARILIVQNQLTLFWLPRVALNPILPNYLASYCPNSDCPESPLLEWPWNSLQQSLTAVELVVVFNLVAKIGHKAWLLLN